MKVTLAQLNPFVGDIEGNKLKIMNTVSQQNDVESDLVVFPELFLVGYPPKDLLERPWFIDKAQQAIQELVQFSARYPHPGILFGAPLPTGKNGR
ncbi:MAG: nitrilase-related carbon-nitrogen hydrolase [Candidatus Aminicenantales bacterium]